MEGKSEATSMPWTTRPPSKPATVRANASSRWTGLRSPLTSEYRTTSDSENRLDSRSTWPTRSRRAVPSAEAEEKGEQKEARRGREERTSCIAVGKLTASREDDGDDGGYQNDRGDHYGTAFVKVRYWETNPLASVIRRRA
ncbi:hypothetical protein BHE74_00036515 [Ensete ventricosum]|nr:hypothetical protein GW17_00013036 [Ensete ventricosum]RWW56757.1 hypothetical protein BHE74_00036515 [Ensete ventricosum]